MSRGGEIRVAIAAAYTLNPEWVAMHVLMGDRAEGSWGGLAKVPIGTKVLLRHPLEGKPGPVEVLIAGLCAQLSIEVEWRQPVPGEGGLGTIHRDEKMVKDADAVLTYIDQRRQDEGGTARLTKMAMHTHKPVWSFAPVEDQVAYVGASERIPVWAT